MEMWLLWLARMSSWWTLSCPKQGSPTITTIVRAWKRRINQHNAPHKQHVAFRSMVKASLPFPPVPQTPARCHILIVWPHLSLRWTNVAFQWQHAPKPPCPATKTIYVSNQGEWQECVGAWNPALASPMDQWACQHHQNNHHMSRQPNHLRNSSRCGSWRGRWWWWFGFQWCWEWWVGVWWCGESDDGLVSPSNRVIQKAIRAPSDDEESLDAPTLQLASQSPKKDESSDEDLRDSWEILCHIRSLWERWKQWYLPKVCPSQW